MAESIRRDGCLQPIRVRATEHGDFVLIAGERRYRAAVKAAVMELPAIIRPAGAGDEDERAALLIEALIENDLRRDLDPVARAWGFQRLVDSGLTVKGVAERLQTTQARVREHLRILKLPEQLLQKVAAGDVPLRAVKSLAQLEGIHAGVASAAAHEVLHPQDSYEPYTWADVERVPLEVALAGGDLPEGVYRAHTTYPVSAFTLGEGPRKDLAALERMLGRSVGEVRFDTVDVEQARSLGAAHGEGWQSIIVGPTSRTSSSPTSSPARSRSCAAAHGPSATLLQATTPPRLSPLPRTRPRTPGIARPPGRARRHGGQSGRPSARPASRQRGSTWSSAAPSTRRCRACGSTSRR